ncbi:UDP-glucose/GDP-mannose dehydrogenase family protein [Candidatus Peregrinibacteria bacterium]|nr:UDP-glucose/GDP-mannose dehydrogenase family protein [Candidatus Peregrinibacteria bacterium]
MNIAIIGAGYVGLTCAAVFSKLGHAVHVIDSDGHKIIKLSKGLIPFYEPGLEALVKKGFANKNLRFTRAYEKAVPNAKVIFLCVGTPPKKNGSPDLSHLFSAVESLRQHVAKGAVVAIKSTVPAGTAEKVGMRLKNAFMASCPEFLREGSAIRDTLHPDRIVIGVNTPEAQKILLAAHERLLGERVVTDLRTAEMIKYASNAFLATKISFINEIANLCEEVGANADDIALGMGLDPRIGKAFLKAGIGYGGSCFPKDTRALQSIALSNNYDFQLLKAVIEVNQKQREKFLEKIDKAVGPLKGKTLGVLGLAFKNNTDDVRESAAIEICQKLMEKGAAITAFDPQAMANAKKILPELKTASRAEEVFHEADGVIILTEWPQFTKLPWNTLKNKMAHPIIFDGRNLLNPGEMGKFGYTYLSVGR